MSLLEILVALAMVVMAAYFVFKVESKDTEKEEQKRTPVRTKQAQEAQVLKRERKRTEGRRGQRKRRRGRERSS